MKLILAAFLFFTFTACTPRQEQANTTTTTADGTTEKNKELVRTVFYEMAGKQNYALIDTFFAPNIFDHGAFEGQQQGREGFKKAVAGFLGMFSKIEIKVEEILADRDIVASRETWKVTIDSTKKTLSGETMHFFRIKDGHITEEWSKGWDWLGL